MYVSSMLWRFKPGTRDRVRKAIQDQVLPAVRQVEGLRHWYVAPVEEDSWVSVLLYDSQTQAEAGLSSLTPIARQAMGDELEGTQRHAGEIVFEEHRS
jgi:quinol monooxygenase YgiN